MKFPAGTDGGIISNPQDEGFIRDLMAFVGAIEIETGAGHGFILTENGNLISAYFRSDEGAFRGKEALSHMTLGSGGNDDQTFSLRRYDPGEFSQAVRISRDEHLLLPGPAPATPAEAPPAPQPGEQAGARQMPERDRLARQFPRNTLMRPGSGRSSVSPA